MVLQKSENHQNQERQNNDHYVRQSQMSALHHIILQNTLIPVLKDHLSCWKRCDKILFHFVKNGSVENVLLVISNFYSPIKFTYEVESCSKLSFLDIQLIRTRDNIDTCVRSLCKNFGGQGSKLKIRAQIYNVFSDTKKLRDMIIRSD